MEEQNSNEITLLGYSERGIMNALFYGIAYNKESGKKNLLEFLTLAVGDEAENYSKFEIIMEGSLSDFGDSDAIIIAKRKNNEMDQTVFFIEAKVSNGEKNNTLEKRYKKFHDDFKGKIRRNGYSSNLFYQLCLKHYLFKLTREKEKITDLSKFKDEGLLKVLIESAGCRYYDDYIKLKGDNKLRKFGNNPIVHKFINKISDCKSAQFIAIIPDNEIIIPNFENDILQQDFIDNLHFITWNGIEKKANSNNIFIDVIVFNTFKDSKGVEISLITNNC